MKKKLNFELFLLLVVSILLLSVCAILIHTGDVINIMERKIDSLQLENQNLTIQRDGMAELLELHLNDWFMAAQNFALFAQKHPIVEWWIMHTYNEEL